eukprot:scpid43268/ scgid17058/ 
MMKMRFVTFTPFIIASLVMDISGVKLPSNCIPRSIESCTEYHYNGLDRYKCVVPTRDHTHSRDGNGLQPVAAFQFGRNCSIMIADLTLGHRGACDIRVSQSRQDDVAAEDRVLYNIPLDRSQQKIVSSRVLDISLHPGTVLKIEVFSAPPARSCHLERIGRGKSSVSFVLEDVNECSSSPCNACVNTFGSYSCQPNFNTFPKWNLTTLPPVSSASREWFISSSQHAEGTKPTSGAADRHDSVAIALSVGFGLILLIFISHRVIRYGMCRCRHPLLDRLSKRMRARSAKQQNPPPASSIPLAEQAAGDHLTDGQCWGERPAYDRKASPSSCNILVPLTGAGDSHQVPTRPLNSQHSREHAVRYSEIKDVVRIDQNNYEDIDEAYSIEQLSIGDATSHACNTSTAKPQLPDEYANAQLVSRQAYNPPCVSSDRPLSYLRPSDV